MTLDVVFLAISSRNFEKNSKKRTRGGCWPESGWGGHKGQCRTPQRIPTRVGSQGAVEMPCWVAKGSAAHFIGALTEDPCHCSESSGELSRLAWRGGSWLTPTGYFYIKTGHIQLHTLCHARSGDTGPMFSKLVTRERPQGHREGQLGLHALQTSSFFFAAQQVRQQKCHSLRTEMEGEAMVRKVNSQVCGRQAGNWLLHTLFPVPDSPNRSHDRYLGTTCLSLFLIKQANRGWIPTAEAPIRRPSRLPPCMNTQMGSLFRGRATR